MLVLSRREHERIIVTTEDGIEIQVCVVRIKGHRVQLGIDAPKSINIKRQELVREFQNGDNSNE